MLTQLTKNVKKGQVRVKIKTTHGDMSFKLFEKDIPKAVENFLTHAKNGYYNGVIFHRVIKDFMIQGGDPTGTGMGGPGYKFEDEVNNGLNFSSAGKLAMANAGPGTNGSQFFITTVPTEWLNDKHTIFGEVASKEDFENVKKLSNNDVMRKVEISGTGIKEFLAKYNSRISEWDKALGYKK